MALCYNAVRALNQPNESASTSSLELNEEGHPINPLSERFIDSADVQMLAQAVVKGVITTPEAAEILLELANQKQNRVSL